MTEQLELQLEPPEKNVSVQFDSPEEKMVRQFRAVFGASTDINLWLKLIDEELGEFDAALQNLLKEFTDVVYVLIGAAQLAEETNADDLDDARASRIDAAANMIDLLFSAGTVQEAFRRVHASNMSKLGDDGNPVRREDGKIAKGPNYVPADLTDLVGTTVV